MQIFFYDVLTFEECGYAVLGWVKIILSYQTLVYHLCPIQPVSPNNDRVYKHLNYYMIV